jgi:hypothetical protein
MWLFLLLCLAFLDVNAPDEGATLDAQALDTTKLVQLLEGRARACLIRKGMDICQLEEVLQGPSVPLGGGPVSIAWFTDYGVAVHLRRSGRTSHVCKVVVFRLKVFPALPH